LNDPTTTARTTFPYTTLFRSAVLRELAGWQEPKSRIELERWIREREGALIRAAKAALADLGLEYEVRVEVGDFPFPQKSWGELVDRKSTRLNSSHVKKSYAVF